MEGNQARLCPKCGTPLMEDNFCMGCGIYVDPDSGAAKGKDSVVGYGESDNFGSFGISPTADPAGIIGESGASDNAASNYGTTGYGATGSYGTTGNYGASPAGSYDSTGSYGNAGSYGSAGNYNTGNYNAGGYDSANGNPSDGFSAGAVRGYSDKPSFLVSVLVMLGIAFAVFLGIFVTDTMTKLKVQTMKYTAPSEGDGYEESWQVDYKGDQVLQISDIHEFSLFGKSEAEVASAKGELEDELHALYDAYPSIDYKITVTGSVITATVTFGKLDTKEGMQAWGKAENVTMSKDASYISAKSVEKSLTNNGWKKR